MCTKFGQNPLKDVDPRVFTRMLRKDGRKRYYMPSELRWRGDNKQSILSKKNFLIPYNPFLQFAQTNLAYTINKRKELLNLAVRRFLLS